MNFVQDANEDTEWNDILRSHGILPPKAGKEAEVSEETIQTMIDHVVEQKMQAIQKAAKKGENNEEEEDEEDEDEDLLDSDDERAMERYRQQRLAEMKAAASKNRFGTVVEISGQDYVDEVTKAGPDIWVVLHLYASGVPICSLIHNHMQQLAARFPQTKFLRSVATTCIPNFPERNLPTICIYFEGDLKKQFVGSQELRGEKLTVEELEFMLGQVGAIPTKIQEDPRAPIADTMMSDLKRAAGNMHWQGWSKASSYWNGQ